MTVKPIPDRAEVALDFPEKLYLGSFSHHSGFETSADAEGVMLKLVHSRGERRVIEMHLHYYLLADVLGELARQLAERPELDKPHRERLADAVEELRAAVAARPG
jgi:hypothetical protein